jgi:S-adenosylmethionine:tRNA ribosyltransferase-isomerase
MNGGKQILLSDYQYELPEMHIAFHPPAERGSSKLLVYRDGHISHQAFKNLPDLLPENSLLIFNESRVIPARIKTVTSKGKQVELFLLKPAGGSPDPVIALNASGSSVWECMVGRRKDWKDNEVIHFYPEGIELQATWENRELNHIRFSWAPENIPFAQILEAVGKIPLPPYISRDVDESDKQTYQTVYSKTEGSVAAPTAGLHFTDDVLGRIQSNGHLTDFVTLHVGAGTFMPVKSDNMLQHQMHTELLSVRLETIEQLASHSGALVPVGTTSLRVLESLWHLGAADHLPSTVEQFPETSGKDFTMQQSMQRLADKMKANDMPSISAQTAIMIFPGYKIHACDALITNFHQPGSTLLMLVSALVGEDWKGIYETAKENGYRFLSYGDSSLLFAQK